MPKVHWQGVPQTSSYRTVAGVIPPHDGADALYSMELKLNLYLVTRACGKLHLKGRYGLQAVRNPQLEVRAAFENATDAEAFETIVGLMPPLPAESSFLLDAPNSAKLETIAGPPSKGAGRRARERAASYYGS